MQTHKAKRVEIIIEAPMEGRLTSALERRGSPGSPCCRSWADRAGRAAGPARVRSAAAAWWPWCA